jgi:hypothetical protein
MKRIPKAATVMFMAAAFLAAFAGPARAADTPVTGRSIKMKDKTQPGTARRKLGVLSRDPTVAIPGDGGAGDPTLSGGSIELLNTSGSGESDTVDLPAGNWRRVPSSLAKPLRGWLYKEIVDNPPTNDYKIYVLIKSNSSGTSKVLKAKVKDYRGTVLSYTLDEPSQGSMGVLISTGTDQHCMDFGGEVRHDEGEVLGDGVHRGKFGARLAPAPPSCNLGSPGAAFIDAPATSSLD